MTRKIVSQLIVPSRQRRFLTFLLALIAGTGMSLQAENVEINGIAYELSDTTATVVENVKRIGWLNCNYSGSITIPATVEYEGVTYTVTKIGNGAFEHVYDETDGVTSVSIPSTVTSIGSRAFYSCDKMTSITCAATTPPTCGSNCFEGVPKNIPVNVPAGCYNAYKNALGWFEFDNINDPNGVPSDKIEINGIAYELSDTTATVVENVKRIGWLNCNYSGSITIPATVEYEGVTYTVTKIGDGAFEHVYDETDGVTSVSIPSTVTSIGSRAFYSCDKMTSITCAATTPPTCGSNCFEGVPKNIPVNVPAGCYNAYKHALGWFEFDNINDPNGVPSDKIEINGIAYELSDTTATVVENVKRIGWMNFNYSGPITIPATVEYEGVTYTVTKIGHGAFEHAYDETDGVTSVSIPSTVTSIGSMAFYSCDKMTSITCAATTPPTCGSNCFQGVPKDIPVNVPASSVEAYKNAPVWNEFTNFKPIEGGVIPEPETEMSLSIIPLSGEEQQFAFALIGQITFDEQNMYLYDHQGELLGQQPLTSIRKIVFRQVEKDPQALSSPLSQIRAYPVPAHDKLIVEGVEGNKMVRIYSLQGALLTSAPVVDGKAQVPVADLPNGNYLLQAGVEIIKFIKK